ncbi:MAG: hypothetical protein R3Y64_10640 [Peptostreptococcaceae bacterium]
MEEIIYDRKRCEDLFREVNKLFRETSNLESIKSKELDLAKSSNNIIDLFKIEKINGDIFDTIVDFNSLLSIRQDILDRLNKLNMSLKDLLENDKSIDEQVSKSIKAMYKEIRVLIKDFEKDKKLRKDILDTDSLEVIREKCISNLSSMINRVVISNLIHSVFEGIKHSNDYNYEIVLNMINDFLSELGIVTYLLFEGEKLDNDKYDLVDIEEFGSEITIDYNKKECIKSVLQYPYIFKKYNHIVSEGKVTVWRVNG